MQRISKEIEEKVLKYRLNDKLTIDSIRKRLNIGKNTIIRICKRNEIKKDSNGNFIVEYPKKKCKFCNTLFNAANINKEFCTIKCKYKFDAKMNTLSGRGRINAYNWRKNNPNYFDKIRKNKEQYGRYLESSRKWSKMIRKSNPEKARINDKEDYKKYKDRILAKNKRYRQTEEGKISHRLDAKKRKLKLNKAVLHDFSMRDWKHKLENTKGVCALCNGFVSINNLEMDHTYPISEAYKDFKKTGKKRKYFIHDVVPLCRKCNQIKLNKILL